MRHRIVVGLGFGDEGKGATVNSLIEDSVSPLVVRFNGGHQAGHTVKHDGVRHVFSNFGAGTLQGVPTFWSRFCTFNPTAVLVEHSILKEKGINPILIVDPDAPVVTPYDIEANYWSGLSRTHGTCGVGFGNTLQREEDFYSLKVRDLMFPVVYKAKLNNIRDYYLQKKQTEWNRPMDYVTHQNIIKENFLSSVEKCLDIVRISKMPTHLDDYIYEGAQGILLDQHHGFFPNVTRSNTTTKNAIDLITGIAVDRLTTNHYVESVFVSRIYQTRHGNGFMSSESPPVLCNNQDETNVENQHQGKFRIGMLDLDLLTYALTCDPSTNKACLRFTCQDQIGDGKGSNIPVIKNRAIQFMSVDEIQNYLYLQSTGKTWIK